MADKITFEYDGQKYEVGLEAYDQDMIVLPDSRILRVIGWLETSPPQPSIHGIIIAPDM